MGIKEKIFFNFKYKVVVFLLSVLVWFFVKTEDNYKYTFNIPLRIANLGENRIVQNKLPEQIAVNLWGKGRTLLSFWLRNDMEYVLDLGNVVDSAQIILDKTNIRMLRESNIEVLNVVSPHQVFVKLDRLIKKPVPVKSQCEIETQAGYTIVGKVKFEPDSVTVRGPVRKMKDIRMVLTEKRQFLKVKHDLEKWIKLIPPVAEYVTISPTEVKLIADIQKLMEKPIPEIPVAVINVPPGDTIVVIPSTLSLVLEGGSDQILNVTKDDIRVYIDYEKVQQSHEKDHLAYIDPPPGTSYRDVHPTRFKIVVMKKK
ncbi:hypothetical protein B6D60_03155 [candidate division KSB1 bacterium 4484_87]|nr:MAG: hypothetical protein B6D60_03155 [candidate division KSB1 bacterium 4484_87]